MSSISLADFPSKARKETDESHNATLEMIRQFGLMVAAINFPVTAIAAALNSTTAVLVEVQDANDVRMLFGDNTVKRVQVNASGTSPGASVSADGVTFGASAVLTFDRGQATVYMKGTTAGTVIGTLVDIDGSGLTLGANATVTLS
jgi:hypothetical protein